MTDLRSQLEGAVFGALDDLNRQRPPGARLATRTDTVLTGDSQALDSLGMVNFVVALEGRLGAIFSDTFSLLDEERVDLTSEHFRTVGNLIAYLEGIHAGQARVR